MSMLKLLVNLNSSSDFKLMMIRRLLRLNDTQSNKPLKCFCVCSSLSSKRSHQETVTDEKSQNVSDDGDYFGVESYSDKKKKEHEREKEAWLKKGMAVKNTSVKEVEQYKSEVVERLLKRLTRRHEKKELTMSRTYGSIRFDKQKLDDMVKTKDNRKKNEGNKAQAGSINVHRVLNSALKSVRKSLRTPGNRYEILKMGKSLRDDALKDNSVDPINQCDDSVQESNLSFIDNQYFDSGGENEQLGTLSQTERDARTADISAKQSNKREEPPKELDTDSFISLGATMRNTLTEEDDLSYIDQLYFHGASVNYGPKQVYFRTRSKPDALHFVGEEATSLDSIEKDAKSEDLQVSSKEESGSVQVRQNKAIKGVTKEIIQTDELLGASVGDSIVGKLYEQSSDNYSDHSLTEAVKGKRGDTVEKGTKSKVSSVVPKEMSGLDIDFDAHLRQDKVRKRVTKEIAQKGERQNAFFGGDKSAVLHDQSADDISDSSLMKTEKSMRIKDLAATAAVGKSIDEKNELPKKITGLSLNAPAKAKTPETAYEVATKKRRELEAVSGRRLYGIMNPKDTDTKGFRILTKQVPDFTNVSSYDIADLLKQNIVYDNHDIVAFNKPYGLKSEHLLNNMIFSVKLHVVSGLGKETTGVFLCAKTSGMAKDLLEALNQERCVRRYIVVTKNTPKIPGGEINIPMADGLVDGKVRKVLRPYGDSEFQISSKLSKGAERAVTRYEVLDKQDRCALLECKPLTNVRHQIRAHLAFGLNCPILGDHKYAHLDKLVPMKLHPAMLQRLGIRQAKVRTVPMHIHLRSVVIPEFLNGQNLVISAPLPVHLVKNMKSLRLRLPPRK